MTLNFIVTRMEIEARMGLGERMKITSTVSPYFKLNRVILHMWFLSPYFQLQGIQFRNHYCIEEKEMIPQKCCYVKLFLSA